MQQGSGKIVENITIEVAEPEQGLLGRGELWITVTGPDPLPDYTTISGLAVQRGLVKKDGLPRNPLRYYPAWGGPDEPYEELWVVRKVEAT